MNTEMRTETILQKSKLLIKGLMIGGLVLVLLIPTLFVTNLIEEREARQQEAIKEVSSKWAGAQNITGPVLVLPYVQTVSADSAGRAVRQKQQAYFLPMYSENESSKR